MAAQEAKFTPGPWVSDGRDVHYDGPLNCYTRVNGVIASTRPGPFRVFGADGRATMVTSLTPEEEAANAALIAAAPEMYEALREAAEAIDWVAKPVGECRCSGSFRCVAHSALEQVRAALAQAEVLP